MSNKPDIQFSKEQLDFLQKNFPAVALGPEAPEAKLRHYHGQQSVLLFIRERTRGVDPRGGIPSS